MLKLGLVLLASGVAFGIAAAGAGVIGLVRGALARRVATVPLPVGERVDTGWLDVDTGRLCQVTVHVRVVTPVVDHTRRRRRADKYEAVYRFPLQYTVLDGSGNVFFRQAATVPSGWNGPSQSRVRAEQATVEAEHYFGKFTPPASGRIRVVAELGPDVEHGAVAHAPRLMVYDNVSSQRGTVLTLLGLGGLGGVLALMGGVVAVVAHHRA